MADKTLQEQSFLEQGELIRLEAKVESKFEPIRSDISAVKNELRLVRGDLAVVKDAVRMILKRLK